MAAILALAWLLALQPLAAASADAAACSAHGQDALECLAEESVWEEEDEDQALLQTAGAKLLSPVKPSGAGPALERRPASAASGQAAAPSAPSEDVASPSGEDQAMLQLPGKAKVRAKPQPTASAAAKPLAAQGPLREPATMPPASERLAPDPLGGSGAEERSAFYALLQEPCTIGTALKVLSIMALAATGICLRHRRLAQEESAEKAPLRPQAGKMPDEAEPAAEAAVRDDGEELQTDDEPCEEAALPPELTVPPPPQLANVGTSYAVPISRIVNCQDASLTVEVPVSPSVWPLSATFARLPGEAGWAKVDLTVDIIDAAGLPPLLTCGPPGAAARLESSDGTGGTGASEGGGWTAGDDMEACVLGGQEGAADACLEVRKGSGALVAWIVKEEASGHFSVKRPSHAGWEVRVLMQGGECHMTVSKRSQDIGTAHMMTDNCKSWAGEDGMDSEVKLVQIDTQPDASSPESALLLMCMMSLMVFQP